MFTTINGSLLLFHLNNITASVYCDQSSSQIQERNAFMRAIGSTFVPRCSYLMFNDSLINTDFAYIHINFDELPSDEIWEQIKSSKAFLMFCVLIFTLDIPSTELITRIVKLQFNLKTFVVILVNRVSEAKQLLESSQTFAISNLVVAIPDFVSKWTVYGREIFSPLGKPKLQFANEWNWRRGFSSSANIFSEQTNNFNGYLMHGVTLDFLPFIDYDIIPGSNILKPRPSLDFFQLDVISEKLNFTYEVHRPEDGQWGTVGTDGQFHGVVGTVQRGAANFSLCLSFTLERSKIVDFSQVYFFDPLTFVTSLRRLEGDWQKIVTPFKGVVWIVICSTLFIACLLYMPLFNRKTNKKTRLNFSKSCVQIFRSFLGQNISYAPKNFLARVFLGLWLLYSLLLTTYYKTSLMATLAVPPIPPTVDSLEQLLRSNMKYGMNDVKGSEYDMFSGSKSETNQKIFKKMYFYTSEESMAKVAKGGYAYIYFKSNLENIVSSEYTSKNGFTNMHFASEEFFPGGYSWAFPKGSLYKDNFDKVIQRCIETGLQIYWLEELKRISIRRGTKAKSKSNEDRTDRANDKVVLNLQHLQGAFMALLLGYVLAISFFALELIIRRM